MVLIAINFYDVVHLLILLHCALYKVIDEPFNLTNRRTFRFNDDLLHNIML